MRDVFIAGEDEATRAVITRLITNYAPNLRIVSSLPARGSQLKAKIKEFNDLASTSPVVLLADLDTDNCAPIGKSNLLNGLVQSPEFIINIAVDEVEAWLLADKAGFAKYFGLPLAAMPKFELQKMSGRKALSEIALSIKSSWHLTHQLIQQSSNAELKAQIEVPMHEKICKGKEYNTAIVPFIMGYWNPETARMASDSLNRMILRLQGIH